MPIYDCGAPDCEECQREFGPDRTAAIREYHAKLAAVICRACHKPGRLGIIPQDRSQAICPECCETAEHPDGETGHVWEYERAERDHVCQKCGITEHTDDGYISDRERI